MHMAKRPTIEDHLLRLKDLRPVAHTPEAKAELRAALKDKSNLIIARAASVIREAALHDFVPDLEQSLARLLDGTPADKGCAAMTAVAEALHALEARSQARHAGAAGQLRGMGERARMFPLGSLSLASERHWFG